jgi:hypothetical protein
MPETLIYNIPNDFVSEDIYEMLTEKGYKGNELVKKFIEEREIIDRGFDALHRQYLEDKKNGVKYATHEEVFKDLL